MELEGVVHNGVIVLDDAVSLPEGTRVRITPAPVSRIQPRDEWERRLLSAATDCGVALSHEAVSSEGLYE